jgi:Staphylococcal protein of unknown function (DUF960).
MFNNPHYFTKGISIEIPLYLQNILWYMIESMQVKKQDYLQVFTLERQMTGLDLRQKIIHTQEQPNYRYEYSFVSTEPINAKVFVIDDETHSTMLLADEY